MRRWFVLALALCLLAACCAVMAEAPGMTEPPAAEVLPAENGATIHSAVPAENGATIHNGAPAEDGATIHSAAPAEDDATIHNGAPAEDGATIHGAVPAEDDATIHNGTPAEDDTTIHGAAPAEDGEAPLAEAAPEEAEASVPSVVADMAQRLPLSGVKIGIDPGHQARGNSERETVAPNSGEKKAKVTSGTTGVATGIPEYMTVLEIAFKLRDALQLQGAEVFMTRESHDVDISNQERARMMNEFGVDLVLRIHCDGAENRSKRGIALYCSRSNAIAAESYRAAEAILPRVCEATGAKANGIISNDNYTGQNWSEVPCIMVECGFLSNPDEDRLLNDPDYQWKLAAGLTDGIIDYIALRDGE